MCGRYSFSTSKEKLEEQFGKIEIGNTLEINFNVAPTQQAYVITNDAPEQLQQFQWGLIPFWSKDSKYGGRLINARSEGIEKKPSFREPIRKRRCWVIADSFYEWKRGNNGKTPYRIFLKNGNLLVLAGIWDVWRKEDQVIRSFSILTTAPNMEVAPIHDRMPLILTDKEQQARWLDEQKLESVLELMHTPSDDILDMYAISTRVNSVRNNGPELHEPALEQGNLFN